MAATRAQSASRNGSNPSPVTFERGQIGARFEKSAPQERGDGGLNAGAIFRRDAVDLRQGHHSVADAKQGEDIEVFAGLRHDAVVGGHDEDDAVHAAGAGDHRFDEVFMARHIDDADLGVADFAGGEAEFDRHPPLFLLLEPIGFAAGEAFHQRGFSVIDMPGGAKGDVDLLQRGNLLTFVCPKGAAVLPGQGNALVGEGAHRGYRPNGPTVPPGERLARWADANRGVPSSPGRCPGLGEPGAFGPSIIPTPKPRLANIELVSASCEFPISALVTLPCRKRGRG